MARVFVNDTTLTAIADAIREKNGSEDTYKPSQMADAVRGIQSGGVYDENKNVFYYDLQNVQSIDHLFHSIKFPNESTVYLNVPNLSECYECLALDCSFYNTDGVAHIVISGKTHAKAKMYRTFLQAKTVKSIDLSNLEFAQGVEFSLSFNTCPLLEEIKGTIDLSMSTNGAVFQNSKKLRELRIAKNSCSMSISFIHNNLLTDESIQSIIDGLADLTGSEAKTITFHADVKSKLTEEQIATITSKNWTLA